MRRVAPWSRRMMIRHCREVIRPALMLHLWIRERLTYLCLLHIALTFFLPCSWTGLFSNAAAANECMFLSGSLVDLPRRSILKPSSGQPIGFSPSFSASPPSSSCLSHPKNLEKRTITQTTPLPDTHTPNPLAFPSFDHCCHQPGRIHFISSEACFNYSFPLLTSYPSSNNTLPPRSFSSSQ